MLHCQLLSLYQSYYASNYCDKIVTYDIPKDRNHRKYGKYRFPKYSLKSGCFIKPVTGSHLLISYSSPFQGGNAGSNPAGDAKQFRGLRKQPFYFIFSRCRGIILKTILKSQKPYRKPAVHVFGTVDSLAGF